MYSTKFLYATPVSDPGKQNVFGDAGPFLGAGLQLAVSVISMALLGWWLDNRWHTTPWLILAGVIFGTGAGMYQFFKTVNEISKNEDKENSERLRK